jgi:hypothetical protein
MTKTAIFVEGQTEVIFIEKLLCEIFTACQLKIKILKLQGGGASGQPRSYTTIKASAHNTQASYFFLIYDCTNDERVKSDIIEQFPTLTRAGYSNIIGIRDVYPNHANIVKIRQRLYYGMSNNIRQVTKIVLAVNETEAWFLADENHYNRIHPNLSVTNANSETRINVSVDSTEGIVHPAETLHKIYKHVGLSYLDGKTKRKTKTRVQRTVAALDFNNLRQNVRNRNNSFDELLQCIETVI